jgi:hypothetical protein
VVAEAVFLPKAHGKRLHDLVAASSKAVVTRHQGLRYPGTSTTKACTGSFGPLTDHRRRRRFDRKARMPLLVAAGLPQRLSFHRRAVPDPILCKVFYGPPARLQTKCRQDSGQGVFLPAQEHASNTLDKAPLARPREHPSLYLHQDLSPIPKLCSLVHDAPFSCWAIESGYRNQSDCLEGSVFTRHHPRTYWLKGFTISSPSTWG